MSQIFGPHTNFRLKVLLPPVAVLVAARDLTAGQALQPADLARREMPSGYLPSGTVGSIKAVRRSLDGSGRAPVAGGLGASSAAPCPGQ